MNGTEWGTVDRNKLKLLTLNQLRHLRNSIYARHGYTFKDPDMDKYFRKIERDYKPNPEYNEVDLTHFERENIEIILEYEKSLKGL